MAVRVGTLLRAGRAEGAPFLQAVQHCLAGPNHPPGTTATPSPGWTWLHGCWPPEGMCTAWTGLCSGKFSIAAGGGHKKLLGHLQPRLRVCNSNKEERKIAKEKQKLLVRREPTAVRSSGESPKAPKAESIPEGQRQLKTGNNTEKAHLPPPPQKKNQHIKKDASVLLMAVTSRRRCSFVPMSAIRISYTFSGHTSRQTPVPITAMQAGLLCSNHRLGSCSGT